MKQSTRSATEQALGIQLAKAIAGQDAAALRALKATGVANSARSAAASWPAIAFASWIPSACSVAERVDCFIADPLPHSYGAAQRGIRDEVVRRQLLGLEADRADQIAAAGLGIPLQQIL